MHAYEYATLTNFDVAVQHISCDAMGPIPGPKS